jgi:hypothetical protein
MFSNEGLAVKKPLSKVTNLNPRSLKVLDRTQPCDKATSIRIRLSAKAKEVAVSLKTLQVSRGHILERHVLAAITSTSVRFIRIRPQQDPHLRSLLDLLSDERETLRVDIRRGKSEARWSLELGA